MPELTIEKATVYCKVHANDWQKYRAWLTKFLGKPAEVDISDHPTVGWWATWRLAGMSVSLLGILPDQEKDITLTEGMVINLEVPNLNIACEEFGDPDECGKMTFDDYTYHFAWYEGGAVSFEIAQTTYYKETEPSTS